MRLLQTLFLVLSTGTSEAFVVLPQGSKIVHSVLKASETTTKQNDDEILLSNLQHEYKVLQEQLERDLVITHDEDDAELVEEHLLEIAEGANTLHKHQQYTAIDEAAKQLDRAESNMESARALKRKALDHLIQAEREKSMIEEMDAQKADLDMLKNLAKEHNTDIDVIHEAERLELQYSFDELEAQHKIQAAQFLLQELQENESILKAALGKLREEKQEKHNLLAEHRSFLDKVKDAIYSHPDLLSSLDPHIL